MKRVVVIGGGAAGLMAAVIAGREGAKVTLLEKMNYVGKRWALPAKDAAILRMLVICLILLKIHRAMVSFIWCLRALYQ